MSVWHLHRPCQHFNLMDIIGSCMHTHTHLHARAHTHTHTHTHTLKHTRTYKCMQHPQAVSAIKSMVVERPHPIDAPLAGCVVELLLSALADADRHVRRAAVVSLSAVGRCFFSCCACSYAAVLSCMSCPRAWYAHALCCSPVVCIHATVLV